MRCAAVMILLLLVLMLCGCMISEQEGERTHVNSPHPEEITFHFHTPFNMALLFGRSGLLLSAAFWAFNNRAKGGKMLVPIMMIVVSVTAAAWSFKTGWDKAFTYRIEVRPHQLRVQIPSQPELEVAWRQIEAIEVEGMARDVRVAPGRPFWSTEWEDLRIALADGTIHEVNLRPLSIEQRGNLWRAIRRKAKLGDKIESISDIRR